VSDLSRENKGSKTAMRAQLKKWGNSLALRVPTGLLAELNLSENSTVDLKVEDGKLIVAPMQKKKWK